MPTPDNSPIFLDASIRDIQAAVEQKFLFRKIGLPYDYASGSDDFPSKAFATAKEARANLPNPLGLGSGYFLSCRNHALLFDAYLLRIEIGIESAGDETILDRLIGGLIRLATVAPKSFLIGGLAPDGRGFYARPVAENHAAWACALARGLETAAIAPESQEKFRSIAGKWFDRVKREKFRLLTIDGKPCPDADLSAPTTARGPLALGMALAAALASRDEKDYELYATLAEEDSRARMGEYHPCEGFDAIPDLLWRQSSWTLIAAHDPEPARREIAKRHLHENALAASRHIAAWREWDPGLADTPVDLEWRACPKLPLEESPLGFAPPESWERMDRERLIAEAMAAAHIMLLSGDVELLDLHAGEIGECLSSIPWNSLTTLRALAPAIAVHARGVEMGLWDKELYDSRRVVPASENSLAAKYLEPDYDQIHPEQAGHLGPPPGKRKAAEEEAKGEGGGKRKRRRRRK